MRTIRNIHKTGICLSLMVFTFGGLNAWAVVPYSLPPELVKAERVQAEKQEIIRRIENLKKEDIAVVKEIRNELNQIVENNSDSLPKDEPRGERH